jgi:hypothetical protein
MRDRALEQNTGLPSSTALGQKDNFNFIIATRQERWAATRRSIC